MEAQEGISNAIKKLVRFVAGEKKVTKTDTYVLSNCIMSTPTRRKDKK